MLSSSMNSSTSQLQLKRPRPPQILLGITGSVASIKGPELALSIAQSLHARVIVVLTSGGTNFWYKAKDYNKKKWMEYRRFMGCGGDDDEKGGDHHSNCGASDSTSRTAGICGGGAETFEKTVFSMLDTQVFEEVNADGNIAHDFNGEIAICRAQDEWDKWNKIGDPVLHIQLRDWADMIIVAPLSAHTLAKVSNGLCDDTLSCILRAWDYGYLRSSCNDSTSSSGHELKTKTKKQKPIIIAPAMNTAMWVHPLTKQQLDIMKGFWNVQDDCVDSSCRQRKGHCEQPSCRTYIVEPQVKTLACGDIGAGAMANVDNIVNTARKYLDGL